MPNINAELREQAIVKILELLQQQLLQKLPWVYGYTIISKVSESPQITEHTVRNLLTALDSYDYITTVGHKKNHSHGYKLTAKGQKYLEELKAGTAKSIKIYDGKNVRKRKNTDSSNENILPDSKKVETDQNLTVTFTLKSKNVVNEPQINLTCEEIRPQSPTISKPSVALSTKEFITDTVFSNEQKQKKQELYEEAQKALRVAITKGAVAVDNTEREEDRTRIEETNKANKNEVEREKRNYLGLMYQYDDFVGNSSQNQAALHFLRATNLDSSLFSLFGEGSRLQKMKEQEQCAVTYGQQFRGSFSKEDVEKPITPETIESLQKKGGRK